MPRVRLGRFAGVLIAGLVAGAAAGCRDDPSPYIFEVASQHRFIQGDDPRFADPDFDDSDWQARTLPAIWRVRTLRADVFGWHRMRLQVDRPVPPGDLAIDLGVVAWSDQVFLNGQRIAGTGWLDRVPRLGPRPRLYRIPDGVLHEGTNLLAIRVRGIPHGVNGLFAERVGIGEALALERARAGASSRSQLVEGLLLGFLGFGWLAVAFFPKRGRSGRATLFLLGSISSALVMFWLLSVTLRRIGLSPEAGGNVVLGVASLISAFYGGFIAILSRGVLPRVIQIVMSAHVVVGLALIAWADGFGGLLAAGMVIAVVGFSAATWLLVGAVRSHTPGAIPISVGCLVAAGATVAMGILPQPFLVGLPLIYYGVVAAIAAALLALTRHIHALNLQAHRATDYALEAHGRERNRLARDLHDGLGQMLALLKLQMQRMSRKHQGQFVQKVFDESADQVAATLDELRRIARDLRPAPMQDRGFCDAVREYAAAIEQRTDMSVEVEGDFSRQLSEELGNELYRITQECLTNCIKHSGARAVVVTLAESGDRYLLSVADDGRGLSSDSSSGLGLATIRERSELLGGKCTISANAGGGTRVEVSVPR